MLICLAFGSSQAFAQDSEQIDVPTGKVQAVDWTRLSGDTRLDTMKAISGAGFDKADTVIIASSANFPDALSATSLAGCYQAPVLLTDKDSLSSQTKSEIERLGATKAIIAGGDAAVSVNIENQISEISGMKVERLSGDTRYETSLAIYNSLTKTDWSKTAIVASGEGFADALSISSYAYATKSPIFLTGRTGLTDDIVTAIQEGGFERVVIVGGTSPIPASIEKKDRVTLIRVAFFQNS